VILEGFVLPFVLKWMAASALPVDLDLTGISTLRGLLDFLAVPDGLWTAFVQQVGDPGHHRLIAAVRDHSRCSSGFCGIAARKLAHVSSGLPGEEFKDVDPWEAANTTNLARCQGHPLDKLKELGTQ